MSSLPPIPKQVYTPQEITDRVNVSDFAPLRPLTIGETLDLPVKIFRDNFWLLMAPIIVVLTPVQLLFDWSASDSFQGQYSAPGLGYISNLPTGTDFLRFFGFSMFIGLILMPLLQGYVQMLIHDKLTNVQRTHKEILTFFVSKRSLRYVLSYWATLIISAIPVIILGGLVFVLFTIAPEGQESTIAFGVGVVGLLVTYPITMFAYAFLMLAPTVQLVEGDTFWRSLKRAIRMVVANFLRFFGLAISLGFTSSVIGSAVSVIYSITITGVPMAFAWVASAIISLIISCTVIPIQAAMFLAAYRDALIMREGYDLLALSVEDHA